VKYLLNLLLLIGLLIGCSPLIAKPVIEQMKEGDLAHKSDTLSLLERAFVEGQMGYLDQISTYDFKRSSGYKFLQQYIQNDNRINLNHKSETATQEFILNGNKRHILVVDFEKSKNRKWSIVNAYMMRNGRRQELGEKGFSAMEYDRNFPELIQGIERGRLGSYYGLAPYGKLNQQFFQRNKVSTSKNKRLQMKNVIIHRHNKIKEMIFITLQYHSVGYRDNTTFKSGWLLEDAGPMSDLYKPGDNLYIDHLLERTNPRQLRLNEPNLETGTIDFSK